MDLDHIQTGDILHCKGSRLISRLIMRFTKSSWSHTALAIRIDGKLFIIDAQKDGVNLRPYEAWDNKYNYTITVCRSFSAKHQWSSNFLKERALGKVGITAYDFESLFIRYPWKLVTGKWRNRGDKEDDRMYCSEFVAYCYSIEEWYAMSPEDVYDWCNKYNFGIVTKNF